MSKFQGIITALVTPFRDDEVDFDSLGKLVRHQLEQGIDGFVVHGTTGESPTVTERERKKIFEFIKVEVSGQVPLIVGTGSNSTAETVEKSKAAEEWGADALLVVVPYYNKPPQRGLHKHFKWVAEKVAIPVILYNVPSRTSAGLEVETVSELSKVDNIIGIKEATGDISFGERIINNCSKDFIVLSGDDATCMDLATRGGRGVISVVSHLISNPMRAIYKEIEKGNHFAKTAYDKFQPLIKGIYKETNPIPIKYCLRRMGILQSEELRLPLVALGESLRADMDSLLEDARLMK